MNVTDPMLPPVRGLVDRSGRLVEADQRLMDLNIRAGGGIGQPIAIPQIATLTGSRSASAFSSRAAWSRLTATTMSNYGSALNRKPAAFG